MREPEKLFNDLVHRFAAQSKCKSRRVGAILVKDDFLIAEGWNSAPCGATVDQCTRVRCNTAVQQDPVDKNVFHVQANLFSGKDLDQALCVHAEANAIGNAALRGVSTKGAILYCTTQPCTECSKLIIAAGIKEVVYEQEYESSSKALFAQAGVHCREFKKDHH